MEFIYGERLSLPSEYYELRIASASRAISTVGIVSRHPSIQIWTDLEDERMHKEFSVAKETALIALVESMAESHGLIWDEFSLRASFPPQRPYIR